ncbi:transglutaminase [Siculibacillus lacustris]|uniref:Transglutaminase n=2 Tax=Siculibacillus lacustris TaxID=1549641 RepID=A0A4Q9VTC0_9HYPH|nr:transglutaminase [Siculibacillus lacustris]
MLARLPETTNALPVGDARPVWGWVDFCRRYARECDGPRLAARDIRLDAAAWAVLVDVNRSVNAAIEPVTDMEHWGVPDRWDLPTDGRGDCEDYVLLKRKMLIERGFPRQALLVTVVIDTHGDGHAVLTARTDHGDFVLDNMRDDLLAWVRTGYRFVKRQSQEDPNRWVALDDGVQSPAMVSTH